MSRWNTLFSEDLKRRLAAIETACGNGLVYYDSWLHGLAHLREVALLAGWIAREVGENVEEAMVAGFLHDCGRQDDGSGNQHAIDSEQLARPILLERFPHLDVKCLCQAIRYHADGQVTDDPLIGAVWDADRLTLERLGYEVDVERLSTSAGKQLFLGRF